MTLINTIRIGLLLLGTLLLFFSWEHKSFSALLLVGVVFLTISTTLLPSYINIMVPILTTGIMLTIAEITLPYFIPSMQNLTEFGTKSSYAKVRYNERIPGFGYRPTPGDHTSRKTNSAGDIVIYDVVYTIGDDGYRLDVDSDNFDIFIYGGSFTFGEGLNDNETLSYYLYQNHGIRTKNVGVHGYGLHQALYNIEQGLTSSGVDGINVLLTSPYHALRSSCKPYYTGGTPRYEITSEGVQLDGVCSGGTIISRILGKSRIYELVGKVLNKNISRITDSDIELYLAIIREIARLSDENNARLLIAYIDENEEQLSSTNWSNKSLIVELSNIAEVVDVTLAERRQDLDPKYFIHELDQHPTALANQSRAKILQSFLTKPLK